MAPRQASLAPTKRAAPYPKIKRYRKKVAIPYLRDQQVDTERYHEDFSWPAGVLQWGPAMSTAEESKAKKTEGIDDIPGLLEDPSVKIKKGEESDIEEKDGRHRYAKMKVAGGRPAVAKKVTADLDSDDELIVRMKQARYLEKNIAAHLKKEGRTLYNDKTIGTRWTRLKKALQIKTDEDLEAGLTDWHEGDDDALEQAIRRADRLIEEENARQEARKWLLVADHVKYLKPVTNFSPNACLQRHQSIKAGNAKPTPESILKPSGALQARIESRREREAKIRADIFTHHNGNELSLGALPKNDMQHENVMGNNWSSRDRK